MNNESVIPLMRADLKMNDPVSITFPAHVWAGIETWYRTIPEAGWAISELCAAVEVALIDPVWYKARHAVQSEEEAQNSPAAQLARFLGAGAQIVQPADAPCLNCGLTVCVCGA